MIEAAVPGTQVERRVVMIAPSWVVQPGDEIADAGLRGRGGAGFPTGTKWRSVASGGGRHHYAVCNAAEGEPGTFKHTALLRANPYAVLEGLLIAAESVGARDAYLAMKASFEPELASVRRALGEIEAASWLDEITVTIAPAPTSTSSVRKREVVPGLVEVRWRSPA